jgi:hypothetical protein
MENPLAPVAKKFPLWAKIVLGVVGGLFVIILIALMATSPLVDVADQQLAFMKAGNISAAYDLTSSEFKATMTLEQFTTFVNQYPVLSKNVDRTFNNREIINDKGTISGTLKATDGTIMTVTYTFVKENGEWKIFGLQLDYPQQTVDTTGEATTATAGKTIAEIRVTDAINEGDEYVKESKAVLSSKAKEFYSSAYLVDVKKGTQAQATLYYLTNGASIGPAVNEATADGDFIASFTFQNDKVWPVGDYKITVSLPSGESKDILFKVE